MKIVICWWDIKNVLFLVPNMNVNENKHSWPKIYGQHVVLVLYFCVCLFKNKARIFSLHCISTEDFLAPPHSSLFLLQKITNTPQFLLFFFILSLFQTKVLGGPVNIGLPGLSHLSPLSYFSSIPFFTSPPSFYFPLIRWMELAGGHSGEFKLFICASLQELPGPRKG